MRAKLLTFGLLLGIVIGGVAGFDIAGLTRVAPPTTLTSVETSFVTLTVSLKPPKWLHADQQVISSDDSVRYVGGVKTVEGKILGTHRTNDNTVFLYFHDPHEGYFMIVIRRNDLVNFNFPPEIFYDGKEVRVTGKIQLFQNGPAIFVQNPSQVEVFNVGFNYP